MYLKENKYKKLDFIAYKKLLKENKVNIKASIVYKLLKALYGLK